MANLSDTLEIEEIKTIKLSDLKKEYRKVSLDYDKMKNGDYCMCLDCKPSDAWKARSNFYTSKKYKAGYYPICKKCLLKRIEQRVSDNDRPNETKESVMKVLQDMDLPYIDSFYENCKKANADEVNEKNRKSPFLTYITAILSLPNWKGKTWKDSQLPLNYEGSSSNKKPKASTIKRFGEGLNNEDYLFLQNEYETWISRYECSTYAQERIFEQLSLNKWQEMMAIREGKPTKDLVKASQELMSTANITPRQNSADLISQGKTFGTMIQDWEEHDPTPDIDPELKDVDKIGLYIDVFFKGHMSKSLKIKNKFSDIYERYIKKYSVEKKVYEEDNTSEELFRKIFGNAGEDEDGEG